jgi:hypothetical protein
MSSNFMKPSSSGLRMPTDPGQINGVVINPPRYAEYGGLRGPDRVKTTVNKSIFDIGNPFTISKPNGGR